jgi:hypothetical protein
MVWGNKKDLYFNRFVFVLVGLLFVSVLLFERNKVVFTSWMKIHHFACGW